MVILLFFNEISTESTSSNTISVVNALDPEKTVVAEIWPAFDQSINLCHGQPNAHSIVFQP